MAFEAFRKNGQPTFYDANKTAWEGDVLTSGFIFAFLILAFSFLIIIPGSVGMERVYFFIRVMLSLFIGAVIVVSQFSMTWECAETDAQTKYKAGTGQEVNVTIGAWIGFKGVNITMKGDSDQIKGETIDYNEHFSWDSLQGRIGFGPFAGRFNQEYRAAQFRGLPLPILWAAEYFTFDGEGIRWGRFYRQAGWYSHIMLWLAFPLWILANVLFCVLLRYGAYFLVMTGTSMLVSNIIWASLRNVNDLVIPFTEEAMLEFSYGGSFWICLVTGILCIIFGVLIFVLDKLCPTVIATFFNVDVLQDSEKIFEEETVPNDASFTSKMAANGDAGPSTEEGGEGQDPDYMDDDEDELYLPPPFSAAPPTPTTSDRAAPHVVSSPTRKYNRQKSRYRSGESRMTMKFQKPRRRAPPPPVPHDEEGGFDNVVVTPPVPLPPRVDDSSDEEAEDVYENVTEATPGQYPMRKL